MPGDQERERARPVSLRTRNFGAGALKEWKNRRNSDLKASRFPSVGAHSRETSRDCPEPLSAH
jgi:hypothetical protein